MKLHLRENVLGQVQFCTQGRFLGPWAERHYKSSMQEIVDEHERQAAEIERMRKILDEVINWPDTGRHQLASLQKWVEKEIGLKSGEVE